MEDIFCCLERNGDNKTLDITKEQVYDLYIEQELSQRDVGKALGISQTSVRRLLQKYNIPSRTSQEAVVTPSYKEKKKSFAQRYSTEYLKYYTKICEFCSKEFVVTSSKKRKKYCSEECVKRAVSFKQTQNIYLCALCGREIYQKGRKSKRKFCDECLPIWMSMSLTNKITTKCGYCGSEIEAIPSRYNSNECCYCDVKCMGKHYSETYNGEMSPTWKGGMSHHYAGDFWRIRKIIRERDNYSCCRCKITEKEYGQQMSVHHIKSYRDFEDKYEANESSNLVCLCETCHRFVHSNQNTNKEYIQ